MSVKLILGDKKPMGTTETTETRNGYKMDPVLYLLSILVVFFVVSLFASEKWFPNDGQIFQVISSLVAGFSGALLVRVKPQDISATVSTKTTAATPSAPASTVTEAAESIPPKG